MISTFVSVRQLHDIPEWWGTAVNVQAMVFGNMGNDCATGVAFTRDPSTGKNEFYGEFLVNAQGEDVVAGIRTPQELTIRARKSHGSDLPSLEEVMPGIFRELLAVRSQLENHYKDLAKKVLPRWSRGSNQSSGTWCLIFAFDIQSPMQV